MHRLVSAALAAAALLVLPSQVQAQEDVDVAFNIGATSDYVFRGVSQTLEDPAVQGGVDATFGSFYAGAWASNVDFGDDTSAEIDLYGGLRGEAAGYAFDVGLVGYFYVDQPSAADYDYVELKLGVSRAIGPATLGAVVFYSPDFFGADEEALYTEANAAFALADRWTLSGAIGRQALDVSDDYTTWNVGLGFAVTDQVGLDVRYHDTDVDLPITEQRLVASVKFTF